PFGKRLGGEKAGLGFTGHLQDEDLGLTYMQARYYDPLIGRFYSNDPIGFTGNPHSFNRYSYANNNPYKYIDPDGREVRAVYRNGTLSVRDRGTGKRLVVSAESGGKPFGASIPPGKYDILSTPREGFFRLEPKDSKYGDDTDSKTGRDLFRLHKPGLTIGCIAVESDGDWTDVNNMLENTETTETEVESKSRNPFAEDKESSTKYGELYVPEPKDKE
ncbi:RHS repeat-associated core domain-containing protein, partial [Shewanella sp.]|uniref:RHS repeat-associated core domain-containing protein n=1 Tax=Shewanella sp. TaxID=50422 RepID=UPI001ECCC558